MNKMIGKLRYSDHNITEIPFEEVPQKVPIIPLKNAVLMPGILLPILVGRNDSLKLVETECKPGFFIALFTQYSPQEKIADVEQMYPIGTLAEIHRVVSMGEGGYQIILQGIQKIKLHSIIEKKPYLKGCISPIPEIHDVKKKMLREFQEMVIYYIKNHPNIPDEIIAFVRRLENASSLANQIIFFSQREITERIKFLSIGRVSKKIKILSEKIKTEIGELKLAQTVHNKIEEDASKIQKEFYLRKQLETIRKELGDKDEEDNDLEQQLEKKYLPKAIRKSVQKEMVRMKRMQESMQGGGMEALQIRNWIGLILELPWEDPSLKEISMQRASRILTKEHEGLKNVKERILEFLAVEKQTASSRPMILCLIGPPGVGKTSLAGSIAKVLQRPLVRSSLGGIRDEAGIRGHRRTYVGALPGKILTAIKKAQTRDPVFLLDEIDKMGNSYNGDPASALLEVLDPEQNHAFEDHYLGEPYNLNRVLFICTANQPDTIPAPLLDRMEVIHISGYTVAEKEIIAMKHLLPKIIKEMKLNKTQIELERNLIHKIIIHYTKEAGVRNLKRNLEALVRYSVRTLIETEEKKSQKPAKTKTKAKASIKTKSLEKNSERNLPIFKYNEKDLLKILGKYRYHPERKEATERCGVAVGMAWTPMGGDILFVETTSYSGKGELKLSGQLGDVMKESAHAALSFLKSHCNELHIDPQIFKKTDIHIHVPSGAIPKDGPSAGVTILSALASLFSQKKLDNNLAMTGEISLRGSVLPVGGIKEKVLAARMAGINTVLLPEQNRVDYEEIPKNVRAGIRAEYSNNMLSLLQKVLPDSVK